MPLHLGHHAMATQFEFIFDLESSDESNVRHAAQAAFDELDSLEQELSKFIPYSDISRLSAAQPGESIPVGLATYDCLRLAKAVNQETGGAFDITVGPLMNLWRNQDGTLRQVPEAELAAARARTGTHLFEIDPAATRITVTGPGLALDLGAVGKGYALDQCAEILRDWSIESALLNAGDSTLLAIGTPLNDEGWHIGAGKKGNTVPLKDNALSASGFEYQGSHIIDPRTGRPIPAQPRRSWALAPTAAMADALSTAFLILNETEIQAICKRHPNVTYLTS